MGDRYKWLTCAPCGAHCLDLCIEDVMKVPYAVGAADRVREVVRYFKGHSHLNNNLNKCTRLRLVLPVETRFKSEYLMLARAVKLRKYMQ